LGRAVAINIFFSPEDVRGFDRIAAEADIVVDEGGFSRSCKPKALDAYWAAHFGSFRKVAKERALVIIDQICKPLSGVSPQLVSWSLANYLLVRGDRTYLAMTDYETKESKGAGTDDGTTAAPQLGIGEPVGDPERNDGLYSRRYQNGIVIVNPSSAKSSVFDLGSHKYRDMLGNTWTGLSPVGPASGHVLVLE